MSHQFANILSIAIDIDDDNKYVVKINRVHVFSHWDIHIHTCAFTSIPKRLCLLFGIEGVAPGSLRVLSKITEQNTSGLHETQAGCLPGFIIPSHLPHCMQILIQ